ncbi:rod shape-determining protein RodA [Bifidobacterium dolichotidis]|uniref:Rod shape-determining protein RodA n=1 Tax=Bifidobacterium dolichotidis TaxID=2306976 RepID=A0A430FT35_9BIFI|nr:DUF3017 domain-containing protein [Bifidobacterium dolichotidis]RSX56038.1 rod shape-determining protein RodA [Bifidobacterium dolichotidis]
MTHPFVSESREGKPWFEWTVAVIVVLAAVIAWLGHTMAATTIMAVTAIATGVIRIVMRDKSPWRIRTVAFDATLGIGFGIVLVVLELSTHLLVF